MRKINQIVTAALALLALVGWYLTFVVPGVYTPWTEAMYAFPITLTAAACVGWVILWLASRWGDHECRCRRCGHILRGLTEPRCPECGERI